MTREEFFGRLEAQMVFSRDQCHVIADAFELANLAPWQASKQADPDPRACQVESDSGVYCSRHSGHSGDHVAVPSENDLLAVWSGDRSQAVALAGEVEGLSIENARLLRERDEAKTELEKIRVLLKETADAGAAVLAQRAHPPAPPQMTDEALAAEFMAVVNEWPDSMVEIMTATIRRHQEAGSSDANETRFLRVARRARELLAPQAAAPAVATGNRIYPCDKCGKKRSAAEGGTVFTVCDECWETLPPAPVAPASEGGAVRVRSASGEVLGEIVANELMELMTNEFCQQIGQAVADFLTDSPAAEPEPAIDREALGRVLAVKLHMPGGDDSFVDFWWKNQDPGVKERVTNAAEAVAAADRAARAATKQGRGQP